VIVPHVLVTGGLVVLADRGAVTGVRLPDRDRHVPHEIVDRVGVPGREFVEVLVVSVRHHEHMSVIARPPPW
jgi:hypothetical protein